MPLRVQLAAILREMIRSGQLSPGTPTPSGPALANEFGVSRYTADRALDLLASEGLVQRVAGIGTIVTCAVPATEVIQILPGTKVTARLPSSDEDFMALPPGVPVLVIESPGAEKRVAAADRTVILAAPGTSLASGSPADS